MRVKLRVYADAPHLGHWSWRVSVKKDRRNKGRNSGLASSKREAWAAAEAEVERLVAKLSNVGRAR